MTNRAQIIETISLEAKEWRRELHRNPQTMYEESFASDLIARELTDWGSLTNEELRAPGQWQYRRTP